MYEGKSYRLEIVRQVCGLCCRSGTMTDGALQRLLTQENCQPPKSLSQVKIAQFHKSKEPSSISQTGDKAKTKQAVICVVEKEFRGKSNESVFLASDLTSTTAKLHLSTEVYILYDFIYAIFPFYVRGGCRLDAL